jgi:hypothetical protein
MTPKQLTRLIDVELGLDLATAERLFGVSTGYNFWRRLRDKGLLCAANALDSNNRQALLDYINEK